jgi:MFS family permease
VYSDEDLNSAVAAGALSAEAAANFRSHMSEMRALPHASEEDFRLLNSFNDIFVSIGIVILLVALAAIGQAVADFIMPPPAWSDYNPAMTDAAMREWGRTNAMNDALGVALSGALVAAAAWPLAEFFTARRRMALPSIILLLAFVGGVFATGVGGVLLAVADSNDNDTLGAVLVAGAALIAAGAAWLHWRRFMVPITVAAGSAALAGTVLALIAAAIGPDNLDEKVMLSLVLVAGLALFAFAMRWDMSDRERTTRRSDVAFWLHLTAAPMIAHPVFALLGVTEGDNPGVGAAVGVLAVYIVFGLVALAVDRRALLVSALAYVLFALTFLFREFGAVELNFALTALVIGSALLSLSAFWQPIRRGVVGMLPESLQARLPATETPAFAPGSNVSPA